MANSILDDGLLANDVKLVAASKGKRFTNFFVDYIVFLVLVVVASGAMYATGIWDIDNPGSNGLVERFIGLIFYGLYYTVLETALKGKSLGKYLTKTKVVTNDGTTPDFNSILTRSFSRAVPFEAFSFLGSSLQGWHDKWSDTLVVDEQLSELPLNVDADLV